MNLSINGVVIDLLIAVLLYYFGSVVIDAFVKDARANEIFKVVLLIVCIIIALGGTLFIHA